jgi:hypothetical protein
LYTGRHSTSLYMMLGADFLFHTLSAYGYACVHQCTKARKILSMGE